MATPYALTGDGFEQQWQTNYLSPFFLIKALLPILSFTAAEARPRGDVRIVNVSSDAAFVSLAPNPDVEDPNLGYLKGMMAAWYIQPSDQSFQRFHWMAFTDDCFCLHDLFTTYYSLHLS